MVALNIDQLLTGLPGEVAVSAQEISTARTAAGDDICYVVLDDDPTGTQSVAGLPILTAWEKSDFIWAFSTHKPAVYVMTNSRSLSASDAQRVNREVVRAAYAAAQESGTHIAFVSRSDSTLRGHFPLEPQTIAAEVREISGEHVSGIVIVPAFADAGRITINATHYAGDTQRGYVPVGETEFANDATFGYRSSYLPAWVEEKTAGAVRAKDVLVIDLGTLRTDRQHTINILCSAKNETMIVVDAVVEDDLRLLARALIEAEARGARFVYRVGPPFVRARIGQEVHAPLRAEEIATRRRRVTEDIESAQSTRAALEATVLEIAKSAGDNGRLFGGVTTADIATAAAAVAGKKIDRRQINITSTIKSVGEYTGSVKLHNDISANIKIRVVSA